MLPRRKLPFLGLFAVLPLAGCVMHPPFAAAVRTPVAAELPTLSNATRAALVEAQGNPRAAEAGVASDFTLAQTASR